MKYKCLSIVKPNGTRVAMGEKTLEIRSWKPNLMPDEDLLIIENDFSLREPGQTDLNGRAVALVNVKSVRDFTKDDVDAACATKWDKGYYSWELHNVRAVKTDQKVIAARDIYEIEITL
ncbi:MAG: ASCH domain-containing protein [Bdellovibrionaceae bacterium]|jgi:hypothetical protein|nr:ASCH domain-containing protein [Pseudobdellovibrionaceae bacterium]